MNVYFHSSQHTFDPHQLQNRAAIEADQGFSENERATLEFCHEWLSAVTSFTVNTSGSTGTPKPIEITRQQMTASAQATAMAVGLQPGMHALVCLPTRFIAGKMMLVRGFVVGMKLTVVEPGSNPLADLPATANFDFAAFTAMQLHHILNAENGLNAECGMRSAESGRTAYRILDRMRAILLGGGPVSEALEQQIQSISAPIYHTYGMTETVSHVALRRLNGAAASPDFSPLPGVNLGCDERGCLHIQAAMTNNERLQTNDLVELHRDGSFRWLGRWDLVINSGGVKVPVEKVERAMEQVMAGRRYFVTGLPDARLGEVVTLILEGERLPAEHEVQLLQQLRTLLDRYQVPRKIDYAAQFAETATGKVDRQQTLQRSIL